MQPKFWTLAGLALTSFLSDVAAMQTVDVVFDCAQTPGACTNMCWGAYCAGYEVSLSYDKGASQSTKRARRAKAGCGSGNRCGDSSPDPEGSSCDEYPFASTLEADEVQQVNRCIPPEENSSQGGTLGSTIRGGNVGQGDTFIVVFGNPDADAVQYCEYDSSCLNDGNQFLGDDLAPDGNQGLSKMRKRHYYTLASGMPILSSRELVEGSKVKRVVKRSQAEMTLMRRSGGNPYDLVDDTVAGPIEK